MSSKFRYGGQAVIEGVMMRGEKATVTVVRRPNGELAMETQPLSPIYSGRLRKAPFIRGIFVLIETLILGIKTLMYSARVSLEEEEEELSGWSVWLMVATSLAFAVALFFLAPLFLTKLFGIDSPIIFNLIEGVIRVAIFILFLRVISLMPDIKRVFSYHGAEHMAVNAYEDGVPLETEAARRYDTAHRRCGTSFLFAVLIIAIIVFALIGLPSLWLMVLSRIVLVPVIAGIGYEVTYFGANHSKSKPVRAILAPGMWLQSLSTRQPDDSQLEVALAALSKAVEIDQGKAEVEDTCY